MNGKKKLAVNGVVNLNIPQGGGGGGTQVQADWNQNDSEAADYIKNRICYATALTRGYTDADSDVEKVTLAGYSSVPAVYNCYKDANASIEGLQDRIFTSILHRISTEIISNTWKLGNGDGYFSELVEGKLWGCVTSVDTWYQIYICKEPCETEIGDTVAVFPYAGYYFVTLDSEGTYQYYVPSELTGKAIDDWYIPTSIARAVDLGGVKFRIDSERGLMVSVNGGLYWKTISTDD